MNGPIYLLLVAIIFWFSEKKTKGQRGGMDGLEIGVALVIGVPLVLGLVLAFSDEEEEEDAPSPPSPPSPPPPPSSWKCNQSNKTCTINSEGTHDSKAACQSDCKCLPGKEFRGGTCRPICESTQVKDKCDYKCREPCSTGKDPCEGECIPSCSGTSILDPETKTCRKDCATYEKYENGKCVMDCSKVDPDSSDDYELINGLCVRKCPSGQTHNKNGICISLDKPLMKLLYANTQSKSGYLYYFASNGAPMYLSWSGGHDRRDFKPAGGGANGERNYAIWGPRLSKDAVKVYTKPFTTRNTYRLILDNSGPNHFSKNSSEDVWQLTDTGGRGTLRSTEKWSVWELLSGGASMSVYIDPVGYISAIRDGKTRYLSYTSTKQKYNGGGDDQDLEYGRKFGIWQPGKPPEKIYFSQDPPSQ